MKKSAAASDSIKVNNCNAIMRKAVKIASTTPRERTVQTSVKFTDPKVSEYWDKMVKVVKAEFKLNTEAAKMAVATYLVLSARDEREYIKSPSAPGGLIPLKPRTSFFAQFAR